VAVRAGRRAPWPWGQMGPGGERGGWPALLDLARETGGARRPGGGRRSADTLWRPKNPRHVGWRWPLGRRRPAPGEIVWRFGRALGKEEHGGPSAAFERRPWRKERPGTRRRWPGPWLGVGRGSRLPALAKGLGATNAGGGPASGRAQALALAGARGEKGGGARPWRAAWPTTGTCRVEKAARAPSQKVGRPTRRAPPLPVLAPCPGRRRRRGAKGRAGPGCELGDKAAAPRPLKDALAPTRARPARYEAAPCPGRRQAGGPPPPRAAPPLGPGHPLAGR